MVRLRNFLIEFGTSYISRKTGNYVAPVTMIAYIRGVQRRLREFGVSVDLLSGPIFAHPVHGLKAAVDNKFAVQQARGRCTTSHNVLTIDDIRTSFASELCNPGNAEGYRNRLVFAVGLAIGAHPTKLCLMEITQLKEEILNGKNFFVYYPKIGSELCGSKNAKGVVHATKHKVRTVPIHDICFFDGTLNVYELIKEYFAARQASSITCKRFFLSIRKGKKLNTRSFFKNQPLGKISACLL